MYTQQKAFPGWHSRTALQQAQDQHCYSAAVVHQAPCSSLQTFSNSFLPASSSALYTPGMPSREMILEMGPVMVSTEFLKASSSLQHRQGASWPLAICRAVLLVMSLQHACQRQCCAGCCLLLKHRLTPSWPALAGPTSALASHISSTGPLQCHARRRAGHSALRRCHFCTRSPVLFLFIAMHHQDGCMPSMCAGAGNSEHQVRHAELSQQTLGLTERKGCSTANGPSYSNVCSIACGILQGPSTAISRAFEYSTQVYRAEDDSGEGLR